MAIETITVDNGTGTDYDVQADDVGTNDYMQVVKLGEQTAGANALAPGDANGLQVIPYVRKTRIVGSFGSAVSTTAYAAVDQVGGVLTFSSAARASGGTGTIVGAQITCRAANTVTPDLDLLLFEASPTVASSDNATADITDANRESARELPTIKFRTADYVTMSANTSCAGRCLDGSPAVDFVTSGSANLYGLLVARAAFTLASTSDLVVALRILQD